MFKVTNKNIRTTCRSGVFIVNFEHIRSFSNISTVDFEQVNGSRDLPCVMLKWPSI